MHPGCGSGGEPPGMSWLAGRLAPRGTRSAVGLLLAALAVSLPAFAGTYVNFDVPGAIGTQGQGVNSAGAVTGYWSDGSTSHRFLRQVDGVITSFEISGGVDTLAYAINSSGTVAGYYLDSNYVEHGFLRSLNNRVIVIDAPGAGSVAYSGTMVNYGNDAGQVAGNWIDANYISHGFLRNPSGSFITIEVSGSIDTVVRGLNENGEAIGWYQLSDNTYHSFLREASGNIMNIDVPGALQTYAQGINSSGQVAGSYESASGATQNFVRDPAGNYTFFAPNCSNVCNAYVSGVLDDGEAVGAYTCQVGRGFRYSQSGGFSAFTDPGAGTGRGQGTFPDGVSGNGKITGWYVDSANATHGFVWH